MEVNQNGKLEVITPLEASIRLKDGSLDVHELTPPNSKAELIEFLELGCHFSAALLHQTEVIGTILQANTIAEAKKESEKLRSKTLGHLMMVPKISECNLIKFETLADVRDQNPEAFDHMINQSIQKSYEKIGIEATSKAFSHFEVESRNLQS